MDRNLLLLVDGTDSPKLSLNHWIANGVPLKELACVRTPAVRDFAYDPLTGFIYLTTTRGQELDFTVYSATRSSLNWKSSVSCKPELAPPTGELALSHGGERIYQQNTQRKVADPTSVSNRFGQTITSASRDIAFGLSGEYYHSETGKSLGTVCDNVGAVCVSPGGLSVWVYVTKPHEFRQYLLEGDR
jgi:hypothetical protein